MIFKRCKNNLVYFGTALLFKFVNLLPRRLVLFMGTWLGKVAYFCLGKDRRRALTHLELALGKEYSSSQRKRIARDSFITFGRAVPEMMRLKKHYRAQIRPHVEFIDYDNFKRIYDRGKGIVAFTGHIGNFELLAATVAQLGFKTAVVGRELYDKRLDKMLVANRTALGIVNVRTDDSPRTILRLLKEGYVIGFLIDTDSFRVTGEYIPFFGQLARTPIGPTQLGLMAKAAFVPAFCFSRHGGRYRVVFGDELVPESYERSRENVYRLTWQMTEIIENTVRAHPEQWIWMHRRWHNRPEEDDRRFLASMKIEL